MTCRHKRTWTRHRLLLKTADVANGVTDKVCQKCGAQMSLGPARDTEQTAIEVRGTSLAHGVGNEADFTACEWMGWNGDEVYSSGGSYHTIDKLPLRNLHEWHAGYLARCIATHDDGGTP